MGRVEEGGDGRRMSNLTSLRTLHLRVGKGQKIRLALIMRHLTQNDALS